MPVSAVLLVAAAAAALAWSRAAQKQAGATRSSRVGQALRVHPAAHRGGPGRLAKIELTAEDIAHSFTVDEYRIAKRAGAGQTVTFEFRADKPGTFRYYCNLAIDDGRRKMHGELVVAPVVALGPFAIDHEARGDHGGPSRRRAGQVDDLRGPRGPRGACPTGMQRIPGPGQRDGGVASAAAMRSRMGGWL